MLDSRLHSVLHLPCCLLGLGAVTGLAAVESQQYLKGEMLIEGIRQNNYTDAESELSDRSAQMWVRARFGAKLELDDRVDVDFTIIYDGEGGDRSDADEDRDELAVNNASVLLKGFLHETLHLKVGRQPVALNLRTDYGALLYDSRARESATADRPLVTTWDGVMGWWQLESLKFHPWYFILDETNESSGLQAPEGRASDSNTILGLTVDWKPDDDGDNRLFLTGTASLERNPVIGDVLNGVDLGDKLITYSLGGTFSLRGGIDLFIEGAMQHGDLNDSVGFEGFGASAGIVWRPMGDRDAAITLQYDYFTGEGDPTDSDYDGFVNTHEGVSDTLIVEHERYGELSELMVGNLEAFKASIEWGFMENRIAMKLVGGLYRMREKVDGENDFGIEYDLEFDFQYNDYTTFSLFGGMFLPGDGYEAVADRVLGSSGNSAITLIGFNAQVLF